MPATTKQIANKRGEKAAGKKQIGKRKKPGSDDEAYTAAKPGQKKERDPNIPKKPMTAYFLFMNAKRESAKKEDPSLTFGTLTKKLTEMWNALDATGKQEWQDLADKDKIRFQNEMRAKGLLKEKPKVDENAPKKPQSSFFHFSHEARERIKKDNPDIKQTEILKQVGAEWKEMDETVKKKWEEKARADKVRYEKEIAAYNGGNAAAAPEAAAGTKRPANKGTGSGSKKAKKET